MVLKFIFNQPDLLPEQFLVGFDLPNKENELKAPWLLVAMAPKLKIFFVGVSSCRLFLHAVMGNIEEEQLISGF